MQMTTQWLDGMNGTDPPHTHQPLHHLGSFGAPLWRQRIRVTSCRLSRVKGSRRCRNGAFGQRWRRRACRRLAAVDDMTTQILYLLFQFDQAVVAVVLYLFPFDLRSRKGNGVRDRDIGQPPRRGIQVVAVLIAAPRQNNSSSFFEQHLILVGRKRHVVCHYSKTSAERTAFWRRGARCSLLPVHG
jgi:hypothetical protein